MSRDQVQARLRKVLGMLGSAHAGERSSAGAQATRIMRSLGLTWEDVTLPTACAGFIPASEMSAECFAALHLLNEWERKFLKDIQRYQGVLTPKQYAKLEQIYQRVKTTVA